MRPQIQLLEYGQRLGVPLEVLIERFPSGDDCAVIGEHDAAIGVEQRPGFPVVLRNR